jgi:hypothetical protein
MTFEDNVFWIIGFIVTLLAGGCLCAILLDCINWPKRFHKLPSAIPPGGFFFRIIGISRLNFYVSWWKKT